jgi:hypothetical protein
LNPNPVAFSSDGANNRPYFDLGFQPGGKSDDTQGRSLNKVETAIFLFVTRLRGRQVLKNKYDVRSRGKTIVVNMELFT